MIKRRGRTVLVRRRGQRGWRVLKQHKSAEAARRHVRALRKKEELELDD